MADKRISELTALTGANSADDDLLVIVDSSASETKSITLGELEKALGERDFSFADDDKLVFGDGDDLQIYATGGYSYIDETGANNLNLRTNGANIGIYDTANSQYMARFSTGGDAELYYNGSEKLATTNTGIDVTGTVTADGLTVDTDTLYVDATNNRVGIGTTSPTTRLQIEGTGSQSIRLRSTDTGTGSDGYIGLNTTGELAIYRGSEGGSGVERAVWLRAADASGYIRFDTGGLNSERMRIDSSGAVLVGTTINDGQSIGAGSQDGTVIAGASQYIQRGDNANLWLSKPSGAANSEFIKFWDNSTNVGSISTNSGRLELNAAGSQGRLAVAGTDYYTWTSSGFGVVADNARDLGSASYRFKDLYLSGQILLGTTSGIGKLRSPNAISIADDSSVTLSASIAGGYLVTIYDSASGSGAVAFITYPGAPIILAQSGFTFSTSDTDGNFCILKSTYSHSATFKNRIGGTRSFNITILGGNAV